MDGQVTTEQISAFGPYTLNISQRQLFKDAQPIKLGSRALEILLVLLEAPGALVTKEDLLGRVWSDLSVDESALRVHMSALRKTLGDGQGGIRYILNETGRGYRFVAPVSYQPSFNALTAAPSSAPANPLRSNLPTLLCRMVGRAEIVDGLVDLVPERRFLTIAGPGGIGKTTVALAVARQLVAKFHYRACFVDLAPLSDSTLVPSALAALLEVPVFSSDPVPDVLKFLRDQTILLVFDNCEHLVDAVALLGEAILREAPGVQILATSREPMRADGEWVHRLKTLQLPPPSIALRAADALAYPAIQMFCDRATASLDSFELTDREAPAVADICRRLDGIPLAIELAAARVDQLDVLDLAARLDDRFTLLTKGRRTALPRQQTLRAALDWSYDLLTEREQRVLRRLSIFKAAFTPDSAAAVAAASGVDASEVFDATTSLVAKSLITRDTGQGGTRYRLLDTTRFYGGEKLRESGEFEGVARRHAVYCCDLFSNSETAWEGKAPRDWLATHSWRIDDVRAAFDWAFSPAGDPSVGLKLLVVSAPLWFHLSLPNEYLTLAEKARHLIEGTAFAGSADEMELVAAVGHALWHAKGPVPAMEEAFQRGLEIVEALGSPALKMRAMWGLWAQRILDGRYQESLSLAESFAELADASGEFANTQTSNHMLALSRHFRGEQDQALALLHIVIRGDEAPVRANHANHAQVDGKIAVLSLLMRILWLQGFPDQASALARECAEDALRIDHELSLCYGLAIGAIPIALWTGQTAFAADLTAHLVRRSSSRGLLYWERWGRGFEHAMSGAHSLPHDAVAMQKEGFASLAGVTVAGIADRLDQEPSLWCGPELLRLKGEASRQGGDVAAAEALFELSLSAAREQKALSWELRTATSLATLRRAQGRAEEGRLLLAGVLGRFTEGFTTADLRQAQSLLDSL